MNSSDLILLNNEKTFFNHEACKINLYNHPPSRLTMSLSLLEILIKMMAVLARSENCGEEVMFFILHYYSQLHLISTQSLSR